MGRNQFLLSHSIKMKNRIAEIDILRSIGLFAVILAHVSAPGWIAYLRSFDVIMMVYVMCWSYESSESKRIIKYSEYVQKRFKRLIVSCWVFLTIYYFIFFVFSKVFNQKFTYDLSDMLITYTTFERFGGTWVIRIYFIISLVLPLTLKLSNAIKKSWKWWLFISIAYVVYSVSIYFANFVTLAIARFIINTLILESVGWILICFASVRILQEKKYFYKIVFFVILYSFSSVANGFIPIELYKYPPTLYYIMYGLTITIALTIIIENKKILGLLSNNIVEWISKNSLWIYYWHLLYLSFFRFILSRIILLNTWWCLYLLVVVFSVLTTIIVNISKYCLRSLIIIHTKETDFIQ